MQYYYINKNLPVLSESLSSIRRYLVNMCSTLIAKRIDKNKTEMVFIFQIRVLKTYDVIPEVFYP